MKSNSADKSDNRVDFLANGIAQVCLIVEDIEEAVKNYWDVFFKCLSPPLEYSILARMNTGLVRLHLTS
jgi:hypothetical protein